MAEKLIISLDNIELEVNDDGDTIILPVSDERFVKKLFDYLEGLQTSAKEDANIEEDDILGKVALDIKLHEDAKTGFDEVFGEGSYDKVYGADMVVGLEYIIEFVDGCMPYIKKHQKKREEKFNKYSANRAGSSL